MSNTLPDLGSGLTEQHERSLTPKTCYIDKLPLELVSNIISELKTFGYRKALPCLSVCKSWNRLATVTIYKSLHLYSYDLIHFSRQSRPGYNLIRNLTVTWHNVFPNRCACSFIRQGLTVPAGFHTHCRRDRHMYDDYSRSHLTDARGMHYAQEHRHPEMGGITRLARIMSEDLTELLTFSFIVDNEIDFGDDECSCHESAMLSNFLFLILDSLPSTCVNVEVDTHGAERHPWFGYNGETEVETCDHVCAAIATLFPRLCSLRLRLNFLCPDFFWSVPDQIPAEFPFAGSPCHRWSLTQPLGEDDVWEYRQVIPVAQLTKDQENHKAWLALGRKERERWEHTYELEKSSFPSIRPPVCPKLQSLVVNLCNFPIWRSTRLFTSLCESGLVAASVVAAHLYRAYRIWRIFPALEHCRVVSSDLMENYERRVPDPMVDANPYGALIFYGAISHFIRHDIIHHNTTVTPFRLVDDLQLAPRTRIRDNAIHEWRDENSLPYQLSVNQTEPLIEQCWTEREDGTRAPKPPSLPNTLDKSDIQPVIAENLHYPEFETEVYEGLLDRSGITEKWFENGTLHLYSHLGSSHSPYGRFAEMKELKDALGWENFKRRH